MKNKIISSIKEGTFFTKVFHHINVIIKKILRKCYEPYIKINNKKIIFLTFQGNYNCNPKALAEELIKQNKGYDLVWAIRKENLSELEQYPKELRLVVRGTHKFYKEVASSKIIIENANNFEYLKLNKKEGQYLLQPWHGSMGFKRLDASAISNENWKKKAFELGKVTDYLISNSKFENEVFRTSYWPKTPILEYGHPRNDILFNHNNEFVFYTKKVKKLYKISKDTKIALYAPTFRDNSEFESYNLDYEKLHEALVKRFGGKWCIMVRFHFKMKHANIPKRLTDKVVNATNYPDMQELLCTCDLGITDYSSWLCDYVLTGRPGFLFTLDMNDYVDERGFYYPLDSTPFPIAENNDELYKQIINFDDKKYSKGVQKFLKDRGCFETGHACEKVVKKIDELTKE